MTAQGEDILAWLNNAITLREQVARLAQMGTDGRWHSGADPADYTADEFEFQATHVVDEHGHTVVYNLYPSKAQSVHIALNDPESVLRRCAADRKLLALHNTPGDVFPGWGYLDDNRWCVGCGCGNDGEPLTSDVNDCPTLNALAEGYGWTGGER